MTTFPADTECNIRKMRMYVALCNLCFPICTLRILCLYYFLCKLRILIHF